MNAEEIMALMTEHFPAVDAFGVRIDALEERTITLRLPYSTRQLRPGGTLSGPTLMTLADTAIYFLILAEKGALLQAVTTHLSIDFLRRPDPGDMLAKGKLIKLGRRLAVGTVELWSDASEHLVGHASVTYALPPTDKT